MPLVPVPGSILAEERASMRAVGWATVQPNTLGGGPHDRATSATVDPAFWKGRSVLITGHTGFKGAWLVAAACSLWAPR